MSLFAIDSTEQMLDAINYAVTNLPNNDLQVNIQTGIISTPNNPAPYAYLYQYLHVRYADSSNPTVIYTSPTNRTWYGLQNTDSLTGSTNPQDYIWYQPSNPFGTTYFLFYSTIGGRQILTQVATTSPGTTWLQTVDGVPIDLDIVIGAAANQLLTLNVYQRSVTAPATPTGGTFNFSSLVLTPPAGWSGNVPSGTNPVYVSTNTFESDPGNSTVPPVGAWSTPVVLVENGSDGTRGFIPMAYVLTPADPFTANTATLNSWFSALRTNVSPPIGVSPDAGNIFTPITGDTAQFYYANTNSSTYLTYNGFTWDDVTGLVIDGDVLIDGTVTANALAANDIYTLRIQSTGANIGNNASQGFWLDATTGTARFGNSINIGNNLTVGNNAIIGNTLTIGANTTIGGNLAVAGLISAGNLLANTVSTTTIVPQAVTTVVAASSKTATSRASPVGNTWYAVANTSPSTFSTTGSSDFVVFSGQVQTSVEFTAAGVYFFVLETEIALYNTTANTTSIVSTISTPILGSLTGTTFFSTIPTVAEYAIGNLAVGNTYDCQFNQRWVPLLGNVTVNYFDYEERNITAKVIKR